jgi:hypothetical protein
MHGETVGEKKHVYFSSGRRIIRLLTLDKAVIRPFLFILFPFQFAVTAHASRSSIIDHERPDHPACCNFGPVTIQSRHMTVRLPAHVT